MDSVRIQQGIYLGFVTDSREKIHQPDNNKDIKYPQEKSIDNIFMETAF